RIMSEPVHAITWLHHVSQQLGLTPSLGGGVAAWQMDHPERPEDRLYLWRPWGGSPDRYRLASFAMVPWANRIGEGGLEHDGHFYPMPCNRGGEPYPIHGDAWLQAWSLQQPADNRLVMTLRSEGHQGSPYHYEAKQTFTLVDGGLD